MRVLKVLREKSITNLLVYGIGQGFNLVTPLLVAPYLIYTCGEDGFGKISTSLAICFLLIVIIDYGSDIIGVKEVAINRENKENLEKIVSTVYITKVVLLLVVLFLTITIYLLVPYFREEKELYLLALPILIGQFINPTWVFQGLEYFKQITFLNIVSKLIYVAGVFYVIKKPADYIYANLWWGLGMIIANTCAFLWLGKYFYISPYKTSFNDVKNHLKDHFRFFASQAVLSQQMYAPVILIKIFMGDAAAGIYAVVERIIFVFRTYILLFFSYVFPKVCYLLETQTKQGLRFWKQFNISNFVFITLLMAVLFVFSDYVVAYFKPQSLTEISALLKWGALVPVAFAISIPLKQLVLGWNFNKQYTNVTMLMAMFTLAAIVITLPFLKLQGVLMVFVFTELITAILFLKIIKKKLLQSD
ncbi:oligosaccharide flippase family protein [Flavobacterium beibuense]|uniref:O-antigen transporter n=1 Tax=Flavobacterium beibuense TaxID=657326 RepID=A0A444WDP6_9FLAO|nr:oligosaccharide flippase family protein [Flavobacterium beibuense]RYJ43915.1 O-antigen transporter [Flavobacterium beibuense]